MAEAKEKILAAEFLKQRELLKEIIKTGSKIKIFRLAFLVSQDIYFEPSEKDIENAFEEAEREILGTKPIEVKKIEENTEKLKKEEKETDEKDALYLLDLFEKYVE